MIFLNKQQGVALLEVLIAFVIVTISVVALYQLQNIYLRNEITASARLTALHIAESKLDDLRTFSSLSSVSSGIPAYDDIGDNTGGVIASGAISSNNANVGNFIYNLSWDVTPQSGSRDITVTVSWLDNNTIENSGIEQVQLFGSVTPAQRIDKDRLNNIGKLGNDKPIVTYVPNEQDVAPTVIPIVLGDSGSIKATTRPLPDIGKNGSNTFVQFDSVTYNSSSNTQALDDYVTLSCDCSYIADGEALTPAIPYITDNNLLYWKTGLPSSSSKKRGASTKSALCAVCCENHFDVKDSSKFDEVYNRLNPVPAKYNILKSGSTYSYSLASGSTGSSYVDSCRLMRIDGYYKPMPDWNLVKLIVMDSNFLDKTNAKYNSNYTNYQSYVSYVVYTYISWLKTNIPYDSNPNNISTDNPILSIETFDGWYASGGHGFAVDGNGDSTLNISMLANKTKQLISRGIFVDILSQDLMNKDLKIIDDSGNISEDFLSKVPFYDINMTKLTRWHPNPNDDTSVVSVTSDPISDLKATDSYYGVYSRGFLTTGSTTDVSTQVTAEAFSGNSSIAAYQPDAKLAEMDVANSEYEKTHVVTGSVSVTVSGTPSYRTLGYVYCFDNNNKLCDDNTYQQIKTRLPSFCDMYNTGNGNNAYWIYQCATSAPQTISVDFYAPTTDYLPSSINKTTTTTINKTYGGCVVFYKNSMTTAPAITCPLTTP